MRLPFDWPDRSRRTRDADPFADDLAAWVEHAFAPDTESLERVRLEAAAAFRARPALPPRVVPAHPRWSISLRPAAVLAMVGALLVGSFGIVAANSGPGQTFYGLRLAAEQLTLPGSGAERLQRQLARLDDRLAEAQQGARAGDPGGVAAALDAYRTELSETLDDARLSGADVSLLLAALVRQEVVLDALEANVPASAQGGLEQAIDQLGHAEEVLRSTPAASPSPAAPAANPGGAPGDSPGAAPDRTPHPTGKPPDPGQPTDPGQPSATPPGWSHRPSFSPGPP